MTENKYRDGHGCARASTVRNTAAAENQFSRIGAVAQFVNHGPRGTRERNAPTRSKRKFKSHTKRGAPFFRVLCGRVGGENARTTKTTLNCRPEQSNRFAKRSS